MESESHGDGFVDGVPVRTDGVVEGLVARVAHLEQCLEAILAGRGPDAPVEGVGGKARAKRAGTDNADARHELVTGRRGALKHAGVLAAGALAGGVVLAAGQATPASASSGNFDGAPALTGFGTGGDGVVGYTDGAVNTGVYGWTDKSGAHGMYARNTGGGLAFGADTSGAGIAVQSVATNGAAVSATTTGSGTAVTAHANGSGKGIDVRANGDALSVASANGTAITATSGGPGNTVIATATGANDAVHGVASAGAGVFGSSSAVGGKFHGGTNGVIAVADTGFGVVAQSGTGIAGVYFGNIHLGLGTSGLAPPARSDAHGPGELHCDNNAELWMCTQAGTPGSWKKLAGPATAGSLHVLATTTRISDSRLGKGTFLNHEERVIDAKIAAVPAGATAVVVNLTATNTNPGGFFAVFANGTTWPHNSSLNWGLPNSTIANQVVVAVDSTAKFLAHCEGVGGADLIVDCIGYYR